MEEDFLSIDVVASELKIKKEQLYKVFSHGINSMGPTLKPSVFFKKPVKMIDVAQFRKDYLANTVNPFETVARQIDIGGLFQIYNYTKIFSEVDENMGYLNLVDIPLCRGDNLYLVQSYTKIHKSDLVIAVDDFNEFLDRHGIIRGESLQSKISEAGTLLKRQQTTEIDNRISEVLETIKGKVIEHMKENRTERQINHVRFVDEAGFKEGKERIRALKRVCEKIEDREGDIGFHGFKYSRKHIKKGAPYIL